MSRRIRELLYTAIHGEGGEMVEGAFVDNWVSNSYTAAEELREELSEGITPELAGLFREQLLDSMTDENVAARVLAILGISTTRGLVLELLKDSNAKARAIGVRAAGYMLSEDELIPCFGDESPQVRIAAIETFAEHRPRFSASANPIQKAFKDPESSVRRAAYKAAGFRDFERLGECLWTEIDPAARRAGILRAAEELRREGVHYVGERLESGVTSKIKDLLFTGLNDDDPELRRRSP
jgi:HEAT repeat protein